eukprot:g8132.t1
MNHNYFSDRKGNFNVNKLIKYIDELEVKVRRRDSHITSLTNELNKMTLYSQHTTERAKYAENKVRELNIDNDKLRNALSDFKNIEKKINDYEVSNTLYYENVCQEFYLFVNSIIKADKSLHSIAYDIRSPVRNSNFKNGSGAMLNGMRLICEKLQLLLDSERGKNMKLQKKIEDIVHQLEKDNHGIRGIYGNNNSNNRPVASLNNSPLEKAIKTRLNITSKKQRSDGEVSGGKVGSNVYMSIVDGDKDAQLIKKIARYKLNKLTKNHVVKNNRSRSNSTSNKSRPQQSTISVDKKSVSRLNLSVASYPIGGL